MSEKGIRLLFVIADGYPTYRPDVSVLFGKYLPDLGVRSDLVAQRSPSSALDGETWGGGRLLLARRSTNRTRNQFAAFAHDIATIMRCRRGQYDAIQVRDKTFASLFALLKARMLHVPFFYWMSFPVNELMIRLADRDRVNLGLVRYLFLKIRGYFAIRLLYGFVLPRADHIFVQSDRMRSDLGALGIAPDKIDAVPMCVDPEQFRSSSPAPSQVSRFGGRRVVAYLGVCGRLRRTDFLVDAAGLLKESHPDILLLLIGDVEERADEKWLRNYILEKGLDGHVTITGWLSPDEARGFLEQAEVALALTPPDPLFEPGTPTKLVDYLAMGKPVVANNHPDQSVVIGESGAGICVPFELAAFVQAIRTMLDEPDRRADCSGKGLTYVLRRRNYRTMAARVAQIYERF